MSVTVATGVRVLVVMHRSEGACGGDRSEGACGEGVSTVTRVRVFVVMQVRGGGYL